MVRRRAQVGDVQVIETGDGRCAVAQVIDVQPIKGDDDGVLVVFDALVSLDGAATAAQLEEIVVRSGVKMLVQVMDVNDVGRWAVNLPVRSDLVLSRYIIDSLVTEPSWAVGECVRVWAGLPPLVPEAVVTAEETLAELAPARCRSWSALPAGYLPPGHKGGADPVATAQAWVLPPLQGGWGIKQR